jgi:hypothetical protein
MSTTTLVVIVAIVVVLGILGAVLVARTKRRQAQASERMGLPPLGTMAGEPIDEVSASRVAAERDNRPHGKPTTPGGGAAKPQPDQ